MWLLVVLILLFLMTAPALSPTRQKIYETFRLELSRYALKYDVPQAVLSGILITESHGDPDSVGTSGERGLMQITPGGLSDVNRTYGLGFTFDDMFHPVKCIETGAAYFSILKKQFAGDISRAIRAYNVGAANVIRSDSAGLNYLALVQDNYSSLKIT